MNKKSQIKFRKTLIFIVFLIIILSIYLVMAGNLIYYDYNSGNGTINFVTYGTSTFPPAWGIAGTKITNYTAIQSDNTDYYLIPDGGINYEGFVKFNFTISQPEANVNWIYWHINGKATYAAPEDADCYVGNFDTSAWEKICDMPATDGNCTINITSSTGSYIDANSQVVAICGGFNLDDAGDIAIDYVKLTIYNSTTCTYEGSGNWAVNCADNCSISSNVDLGSNNITFTGAGQFVLNANITNIKKWGLSNNCKIIINSGNKFG